MASDLSQRILRLETLVQALIGQVAQLTDLVGNLRQQQYQPSSGTSGGGGGGATIFFANNISLGAATGTWPAITPTSTTGDVYKISGGVLVLVQASATILNGLPDPTDATKRHILGKNADDTYSIISQSCSAG